MCFKVFFYYKINIILNYIFLTADICFYLKNTVSDLIDCGGSSCDEVFDSAPPLRPPPHQRPKGVIVG